MRASLMPPELPSLASNVLARLPALLASIVSASVLTVGLLYGTFIAGGADSSGYLSQAELWLRGSLRVEQPIAREVDSPVTDRMLSPLGYRPGSERGTIVPTYAPGLPMAMAVLQALGGRRAAPAVVPLLGALAVWLTYIFSRRLGHPWLGVLAAGLLSVSPVFLFQHLQPMSDVPAATWWLAAVVAASHPGPWWSLTSGASVSAALLTRPNLLPLVLAFVLYYGAPMRRWPRDRTAVRELLAFGVPVVLTCLSIAGLNNYLYGSALRSGYGTLDSLFSVANVGENLRRYGRWLILHETPLMVLGMMAPLVLSFRWARPSIPRDCLPLLWLAGAVIWLIMLAYSGYAVFDSWTYLRFLLPAFPLALALSLVVLLALFQRLPAWPRNVALLGIVAAVGAHHLHMIRASDLLAVRHWESRYERVARYASAVLPERAVVLSMQHSGSLRYYTDHLTLRYDLIASDDLDTILAFFSARGYRSYAILDDDEEEWFRERFRGSSAVGSLDWPPRLELTTSQRVRLYNLSDRAAFLRGDRIQTRHVR